MDLLVIAVAVLATTLASGGAISYITRRDRRSLPSAATTPTAPPRPVRPFPHLSPSGPSPGPLPADGTGPSGSPAPVPASAALPAPGAPATTHHAGGPAGGQEDADAAREALRANQRAMSDPRLSTLDRVQALMASQAFALHLTDQPAEPQENDKRGPRDQREPL